MDHCIFITIITIIYQNIELKGRDKMFYHWEMKNKFLSSKCHAS